MKKRIFSIVLTLCICLSMLPATVTAANPAYYLKIGSAVLWSANTAPENGTAVYYKNGDTDSLSGSAQDYNAMFTSDGSTQTLTLNGLNITGNAVVNASGQTKAGMGHYNLGDITISGNAKVVASGKTYGIERDTSISISTLKINGGTLTAKGETCALRQKADYYDVADNIVMKGSTNIDGIDPEIYDKTKNDSYKWFKSEPAVSKPLEKVDFGYAYDVQRNPAYPTKDQTIALTYLNNPLLADGTTFDSSSVGNWTLTKVGTFSYVESAGLSTAYLTSLVDSIVHNYDGVTADSVIIHELKKDTDHIAYGVVVAYDANAEMAVYLGGNRPGGAGYLLSTNSKSGSVTMTSGEIATDFVQSLSISLEPSVPYTFPAATVGYAQQDAKTVTVTNTGNGATGDLMVALSGTNADSFTLSKTAIRSIPIDSSDIFTVVPQTDLSAGTYTATVSVRGSNIITASFDVSFTVNNAVHTCNLVPVARIEPSCTAAGKNAYYHCNGCGKNFEDANGENEIVDLSSWGNINALGHDWADATYTAPKTCKREGCGATEGSALSQSWATSTSQKGWKTLSAGTVYYKNGTKVKGWQKISDKAYYFDEKGYLQYGWLKLDDEWYYLNSDGVMQTGWLKLGNVWYYLNKDGVMQTGWLLSGGKWYYLESWGGMVNTSWVQVENTWYYMRGNGAMATGWNWVGNKCYYFYESGKMAADTTVDGYKVDANGAWIK